MISLVTDNIPFWINVKAENGKNIFFKEINSIFLIVHGIMNTSRLLQNKREALVLHVRLRYGSLSITIPVSLLANEQDVWSLSHGYISLTAVNQICVFHEAMTGYKKKTPKDSLTASFQNVNFSWLITQKIWNLAGVKLATTGSAVRHVSAVRVITHWATWPRINYNMIVECTVKEN